MFITVYTPPPATPLSTITSHPRWWQGHVGPFHNPVMTEAAWCGYVITNNGDRSWYLWKVVYRDNSVSHWIWCQFYIVIILWCLYFYSSRNFTKWTKYIVRKCTSLFESSLKVTDIGVPTQQCQHWGWYSSSRSLHCILLNADQMWWWQNLISPCRDIISLNRAFVYWWSSGSRKWWVIDLLHNCYISSLGWK